MSKTNDMAAAWARTAVGDPTVVAQMAFREGALYALQEAASDLLRDDHPSGGRTHAKDRVYAQWLRERAVHIGDD